MTVHRPDDNAGSQLLAWRDDRHGTDPDLRAEPERVMPSRATRRPVARRATPRGHAKGKWLMRRV